MTKKEKKLLKEVESEIRDGLARINGVATWSCREAGCEQYEPIRIGVHEIARALWKLPRG